jgi:predicted Zn-dependent protease
MYEGARREVAEALRLDPSQRQALNLRANLAIIDWDWAAAKIQLDELLASGPHDYGALLRSGQLARANGHLDQALAYFRESLQLDPLSVMGHIQLAMLLNAMHRPADTRAAAEAAVAINPVATKVHLLLALLELDAGNLQAANAAIDKESGEYYQLEGRSILAFAMKRMANSDAALEELTRKYGDTAAVQVAQAYAYRGDRAKTFEWLDRAYNQKDPGLVNVKTDPLFASLHGDPRFSSLLRRMNLPEN